MEEHNRIPALLAAQWGELFNIDLIDESGTIGTRCERIFPSSVEDVSLMKCFYSSGVG